MELPIDDIATCFQVNKILSLGKVTSAVDAEYANLIAFVVLQGTRIVVHFLHANW